MSAFHSRTVPSTPAVASRCPSGLNATPVTGPVWPVSGSPRGWPVSGFHSRTVPSSLAVASRCPSGLNATPVTGPVWPVSGSPRVGRCRGSTAAPCRRRRRWPAGARRG